jgi:hypothetical protein
MLSLMTTLAVRKVLDAERPFIVMAANATLRAR